MKHKILSLLLVLVMAVSLFPLPAFGAGYSDTAGHWAEAEIDKWSSAGILAGSEGKFRPDDSITRAEMATIFDRVMAYRTKAENKFTDLSQTWYTDAILRANAAGLMLGDGGLVRPTDKITRQEAAILVCRAIGISEITGVTSFADDAAIAAWAKGYVKALSSAGLIAGMGSNRFEPTASINRASVVKMLDNAMKSVYAKAGEYSGDVKGNVVVNTANVTLKNMTITGNLIIAEGVGDGDVTLDNVKVEGRLIARGGGKNSIHIIGKSQVSGVVVQKTDDGGIRIVTESGSVVEAVFIDDGKDDVILTGEFDSVTVEADVPVTVVNATIGSVNVTAQGASLSVDKGSKVETVIVAETAKSSTLKVEGEVGSLTANAQVKVDNQGTIKKAEVKADDVIIDGKKPDELKVDESVKAPPKDSEGKEISTTPSTPTPPSGGDGGYIPPAPTPLQTVTVRGVGPADNVADFDYPTAYAAAGITLSGSTYTVSQETLTGWLGNSANADAKTALTNGGNLYLGLQFDKPSDASIKKVKVQIADSAATVYDLTTEGANIYNGQFIEYFGVSDTAGLGFGADNNRSWRVQLEWQNEAGTRISATEVTVNRVFTPMTLASGLSAAMEDAAEAGNPYPLMKFSYNRLLDGSTVELKVTKDGETTPYFYEGQTFASSNANAYFTWSLRDLSTTASGDPAYTKNGSDPATLAIERTNDKLIPVGTVLNYTLTASKNGVEQVVEQTYTVTLADYEKAYYWDALLSMPSGMSLQEGKVLGQSAQAGVFQISVGGTVASGLSGNEDLNYADVNSIMSISNTKSTYITLESLFDGTSDYRITQVNQALEFYAMAQPGNGIGIYDGSVRGPLTIGNNTIIAADAWGWVKQKTYTTPDADDEFSLMLTLGQRAMLVVEKLNANGDPVSVEVYNIIPEGLTLTGDDAPAEVTIGNMTVPPNFHKFIPADKTVTVPSGKSLTISTGGKLTGAGTGAKLVLASGCISNIQVDGMAAVNDDAKLAAGTYTWNGSAWTA